MFSKSKINDPAQKSADAATPAPAAKETAAPTAAPATAAPKAKPADKNNTVS